MTKCLNMLHSVSYNKSSGNCQGYGLHVSNGGRGQRPFSSPRRPDQLLFKGTRGSLTWSKSADAWRWPVSSNAKLRTSGASFSFYLHWNSLGLSVYLNIIICRNEKHSLGWVKQESHLILTGPKRADITADWRKHDLSSHHTLSGLWRSEHMALRKQNITGFGGGNLEERDDLEVLHVDRKLVLKWVLKK